MATKLDTVAKSLIKYYKTDLEDSSFVVVENDHSLSWGMLNDLRKKAKRFRRKRFHIVDIEPVAGSVFAPISWGIKAIKYKKNIISYDDRQGIFKITFSDGAIMYFARYVSGYGKGQMVEGLFATEKHTWYKFKKYLEETRKRRAKPKNGFYKVWTDSNGGLGYTKIEKPSKVDTIHPAIEQIDKDIDFFFTNMDIFTQYGQPGTRKVMLIGPPGTGKTSMCIKLSREFQKEIPVVVATDLTSVAMHLQACAKHNLRTLVILEDAETTMTDMSGRTNSGILNFLDGVDQPVNSQGAYIIMTTNHPNKIEKRILKRPGRIDRLFQIGELQYDYALECAQLYFGNDLRYSKKCKEDLLETVHGLTGAEIRELANSSKAYAVQNGKKLTIKLVSKVKSMLSRDLSDAYRFAEENSLIGKDNIETFGFS